MNRPRKWTLDALDPSDPSGLQTCEVWIDQGTGDFLTRGVLDARFLRLQSTREVLSSPDRIVSGWNRQGYDDGRCYIGRPDDYPKEGIILPPKPNMCFFAFVLPSGKMEEWGWEKFDLDSEDDYRKEFGDEWRLLWPLNGEK